MVTNYVIRKMATRPKKEGEKMEEKTKTCLNCGKTGKYKTNPNYCAYCGFNFQNFQDNQNKLILNYNKDNI